MNRNWDDTNHDNLDSDWNSSDEAASVVPSIPYNMQCAGNKVISVVSVPILMDNEISPNHNQPIRPNPLN